MKNPKTFPLFLSILLVAYPALLQADPRPLAKLPADAVHSLRPFSKGVTETAREEGVFSGLTKGLAVGTTLFFRETAETLYGNARGTNRPRREGQPAGVAFHYAF